MMYARPRLFSLPLVHANEIKHSFAPSRLMNFRLDSTTHRSLRPFASTQPSISRGY